MRRLICGGLLVAISACVHYTPRPMSVPEVVNGYEARRLDAPALATSLSSQQLAPAWPPPVWDLQALTLVAFQYHPDLAVARAQWSVSRAAAMRAGERPNPTVGLAPGINSSSPAGLTPWLLLLDLAVPIETADKRGIRIAHAAAEAEAARFTIAVEAWSVRSRVRDGLLAVYHTSSQAAILRRQRDMLEQQLTLLVRQFEAGAISSIEMSRGRVALGNTRLLLRHMDRLRGEAGVCLAGAIGVTPEALARIAPSFETFREVPALPADALVRERALVSRPDLLRGLAVYSVAEHALALDIARQYPDIRLGPGYELDQTDHKWRLALSATLPVVNRNQRGIVEAEARRTAAAADFEAVQARALEQIDLALVALRTALDKLAAADELLRQQRVVERTATTRLDARAISRLDLVTVQLETLLLERAVVDAQVAAHAAAGALEAAVQSPIDLNQWFRLDLNPGGADAAMPNGWSQ